MPLVNKYNESAGIDTSCPDVAITSDRSGVTPANPGVQARSRSHFRRRRIARTTQGIERGTGIDDPLHLNPPTSSLPSVPEDPDVEVEPLTPFEVLFVPGDTVRVRTLGQWLHGVIVDATPPSDSVGPRTVVFTDSLGTSHTFNANDTLIEHTTGLISSRTRLAHQR